MLSKNKTPKKKVPHHGSHCKPLTTRLFRGKGQVTVLPHDKAEGSGFQSVKIAITYNHAVLTLGVFKLSNKASSFISCDSPLCEDLRPFDSSFFSSIYSNDLER